MTGYVLVFVIAAGFVAGGALVQWQIWQARARSIAAVAAANGWAFGTADTTGCANTPFHVFERGRARKAANVCSFRDIRSGTLHLFDYRFTEGTGRSSRTYKHSCALRVAQDWFPLLTIEHESVYGGVLNAIGLEDLQFESEEFNRLFRVTSDDPRFACAVIDARMMAFLLDHDIRTAHISVNGRYLLVWCDQLAPLDLPALANFTFAFWSHIPSVVRELYPGK
jgi:hypothetical protein